MIKSIFKDISKFYSAKLWIPILHKVSTTITHYILVVINEIVYLHLWIGSLIKYCDISCTFRHKFSVFCSKAMDNVSLLSHEKWIIDISTHNKSIKLLNLIWIFYKFNACSGKQICKYNNFSYFDGYISYLNVEKIWIFTKYPY